MKFMTGMFIVGNWKMNGFLSSLDTLQQIERGLGRPAGQNSQIRAIICLPSTLVDRAHQILLSSSLKLGGQDCAVAANGAFTGDVSAEMLRDAGANYVIIGHSERRIGHNENDSTVYHKVCAAWRAGLIAILCVGETLQAYNRGETLFVLEKQIQGSLPSEANAENTIIAYEPVWAIDSQKLPQSFEIESAHEHIRLFIEEKVGEKGKKIPVLYGGSVNPESVDNIAAIDNVDGVLVGRSSLNASDFLAIAGAFQKQKKGSKGRNSMA